MPGTTVLIDNDVVDGPKGNSSYLIDVPNGGDLLMQGNRLQKGRLSENSDTAVAIGFEGVTHPTENLVIRDNDLHQRSAEPDGRCAQPDDDTCACCPAITCTATSHR